MHLGVRDSIWNSSHKGTHQSFEIYINCQHLGIRHGLVGCNAWLAHEVAGYVSAGSPLADWPDRYLYMCGVV